MVKLIVLFSTVYFYVLVTIEIAFIIFVICSLFYMRCGFFKRFFHDGLHWHEPTTIWFDGFQVHSICKHCGKEIMRDSQGNWFLFRGSEANGQR